MNMLSTFFIFLFFCFSLAAYSQPVAKTNLNTPNVSANALFLYRNSNYSKADESETRNGIDLQETEIAFYSDVDPYSRLSVLLAIRPEYTWDDTNKTLTQEWVVEPEELFAESNVVPMTTVRVGKFRAMFGKHNLLHTHGFLFVDAPVTNTQLLGDEGLNDVGASAAILLPSEWYNELTLQYFRGEGENTAFNSKTPGDGVGVIHWKNLFDLSDDMTIEIGGSYAQGQNSLGANNKGAQTQLEGADVTFKWRPTAGGKFRSGALGAEYIHRLVEQPSSQDENGQGYNVWGQYQLAERWSTTLRHERFQAHGSDSNINQNALTQNSIVATTWGFNFQATEFSAYRIEYGLHHGPISPTDSDVDDEHRFYLQANFTIGAHPTHSY